MKLALRSLALLALAVIASVHAQNDARNASGFLPGVGAPVDAAGSGAVSGGPSSVVGTVAPANMTSTSKNATSSTTTRKNSTSTTTSGSSKTDASTPISGGKSNSTGSTPAPTTSASASAGVVASVVTLAITAAAALH